MELKDKLAALRKAKKLSQATVAESLYVSRQAISNWETGTVLPSTDNLKSLSRLYEVPVDYLLNDDAPPISYAAYIKKQQEQEAPEQETPPAQEPPVQDAPALDTPAQDVQEEEPPAQKRHISLPFYLASVILVALLAVAGTLVATGDISFGGGADSSSTEPWTLDSGVITDSVRGLDTTIGLCRGNGTYAVLYVENRGDTTLSARINGQSQHTLAPGEQGEVYLEISPGLLGGLIDPGQDCHFQVSPVSGTGTFYWEIIQRGTL